MDTYLNTAPTSEPLTLADVKAWCNINHDDDDTVLTALIEAARQRAETATRRQLMEATWILYMDQWPSDEEIVLPYPPLKASGVSSITYYDTTGTQQTRSSSYYQVTYDEPARIKPAYGYTWPSARDQYRSIAITYVCGYGSAGAIPESILTGMRLLVGHWYENREATIAGTIITQIPEGVRALFEANRASWGLKD